MSNQDDKSNEDRFGDEDSFDFSWVGGQNKRLSHLIDPAPRKVYQPRCYESHPRLTLGGGTVVGGSCSHPVTNDADIYIGLESGMKFQSAKYPWAPPEQTGPIGVQFLISDMAAPKDPPNFIAMIGWLAERLAEGKTVHVGCVGGHGRTGVVLSALVKHVTGNADAITWVRAHYCQKAVESDSQVKFLGTHFGITAATPTKSYDKLTYGAPLPPKPTYYQDRLPQQKTFAERWDEFIPGSKVPRSRGPRDVAPIENAGPLPAPKARKAGKAKPPITVTPEPDARESIWKRLVTNLTNSNE